MLSRGQTLLCLVADSHDVLGDTSSYHGYTCVASEGQLLQSPSAERVFLEVLANAPNHLCLWFLPDMTSCDENSKGIVLLAGSVMASHGGGSLKC